MTKFVRRFWKLTKRFFCTPIDDNTIKRQKERDYLRHYHYIKNLFF